MIHHCEKCGGDAIMFKPGPNQEPELLCLKWTCWSASPSSPEEIIGGVDPLVSESVAMKREILQIFDKHGPFVARLFTTRSLNQDWATDWMVQLMSDAILNMYFTWWPGVKDVRAMRSSLLPQIIRTVDNSFNAMIEWNENQKKSKVRLDS